MIYYIRNDMDDLVGFKYNDTNYYYDKETNLYYLNSRYYNPVWGRFVNEDSYLSTGNGILGHNMYAYCNNNPIFYVDKDGHSIGIGIVVLGLVITTLFAANSIKKIKKAKEEILKVQKNTNVPDKTDKLNETMKSNASAINTAVQGQNPIQKLVTFKDSVTDGAVYDLKLTDEWNFAIKYEGIIMEPQDIGNFHYGYIGRAIDIPTVVLLGGAGVNQFSKYGKDTIENCFTISFCDDPRDAIFIKMGADKYDSEH